MVQILIRLDPRAEDWTIIELQGALETREGVDLKGKHVGDLHFDHMGVPQLVIGHHLLSGKFVALDKPYAIMKKTNCSNELMEVDDETKKTNQQTEYNIIALVKRKIVFKNRPKPIIIKTEPIRN